MTSVAGLALATTLAFQPSALAEQRYWFATETPIADSVTYDFFDVTRWEDSILPSDGEAVHFRLQYGMNVDDPLNVSQFLQSHDYNITFDPESHFWQPNTVNYAAFEFETVTWGDSTFIQRSGTINVEGVFNVGGGVLRIYLDDVGGVDYEIGGASIYRMEGGTLNTTTQMGIRIGSDFIGGYDARFELAGGTVTGGGLTIGADGGNGSYLQTGGSFSGTSISVGHQYEWDGDPAKARTPSFILEGGSVDVDHVNVGSNHSAGYVELSGGILNLDTDTLLGSDIRVGVNNASIMVINGTAQINPDAPLNRAGGFSIHDADGGSTVTQGGASVARFHRVNNDGLYKMNGGLLEATRIEGSGAFVQNGGTVKATGRFGTPENTSGNLPPRWMGGTINVSQYTLNDGRLEGRMISVGRFDMNGGNIVGDTLRASHFEMNGGTINAGIDIGNFSGDATFNMNDGGILSDRVYIGVSNGGTFNQAGGLAVVGYTTINAGTYNLASGLFFGDGLDIRSGGSFNQTGGTSSVDRFFNEGAVSLTGGVTSIDDLQNDGSVVLSGAVDASIGAIDNGADGYIGMLGVAAPVTVSGPSHNEGEIQIFSSSVEFKDAHEEEGSFLSGGTTTAFKDLTINEGGLLVLADGSAATVAGDASGQARLVVGATSGGTLEIKEGSTLSVDPATANTVVVGRDSGSDGLLSISDGGSMSAAYVQLGKYTGSKGALELDGATSSLTTQFLIAGGAGEGSVSVTGGAQLETTMSNIADKGTALIDGANWDNDTAIHMSAQGGDSQMTLANGADVESQAMILAGATSTATSNLEVKGGSSIDLNKGSVSGQKLVVGDKGAATVLIKEGSTVTSGNKVVLAEELHSNANVTVTGSGSSLDTAHTLTVGKGGAAFISIESGASATVETLETGIQSGATGDVRVAGTGSSLVVSDMLEMDNVGSSSLTVQAGGTAHIANGAVGSQGGTAAVLVEGAGSLLSATGSLGVGDGDAAVTVRDGGEISVANNLYVQTGGQMNIATGGTTAVGGTYQQTGGSTVVNGTLTAGALNFEGGTLSGAGDILGNVSMLSGSQIAMGNSPGSMQVYGDFLLGSGSSMAFDIGGYGAGDYDQLFVSGNATIQAGSAFDITFLDDFAPTVGDTWDLISLAPGGTLFMPANTDDLIFNFGGTTGYKYDVTYDSGLLSLAFTDVPGGGTSTSTDGDLTTVVFSGTTAYQANPGYDVDTVFNTYDTTFTATLIYDNTETSWSEAHRDTYDVENYWFDSLVLEFNDSTYEYAGGQGVGGINYVSFRDGFVAADGTSFSDSIRVTGASDIVLGDYSNAISYLDLSSYSSDILDSSGFPTLEQWESDQFFVSGRATFLDGDSHPDPAAGRASFTVSSITATTAAPAPSNEAHWVCGSGYDWDSHESIGSGSSVCWATTPDGTGTLVKPADGNDIFLVQTGDTDISVRFFEPTDQYGAIIIDGTGLGSMELNQVVYTRNFVADSEIVGDEGTGRVVMITGTHTVNNDLILGNTATGDGTFIANVAGILTAGTFTVGNEGTGTLLVAAGGTVNTSAATLGTIAGSDGTATVTGAGSTMDVIGSLIIGNQGAGTVEILDGGIVTSGNGRLGVETGSFGSATIDGAGSLWHNDGGLVVGIAGSGALAVTNGGTVTSTHGYLGADTGGSGMALVDGAGSNWTLSETLYVGDIGPGELTISNGGLVDSRGGRIGSAGSGIVNVTGAGSEWTNTTDLKVGDGGTGILNITDGGLVSANTNIIADGGHGTVTVDGAGSAWGGSELVIGQFGVGELTVTNGALAGGYSAVIGSSALGYGSAIIDGADSTMTVLDSLTVGEFGEGHMTVSNGGTLSSMYGQIASKAGSVGSVTVDGIGSSWTSIDGISLSQGTHSTPGGTALLTVSNGGHVETLDVVTAKIGSKIVVDDATLTTSALFNRAGFVDIALGGDVQSGFLYNQIQGHTRVNGSLTATDLIFDGGLLSGSGTLNGDVELINTTVLAPGNSPGALTVNGDFLLGGSSTLLIEIGGTAPGDFDQLFINGEMTIQQGATFEFVFLSPFSPEADDFWNFLHVDAFSFVDEDFLTFDFDSFDDLGINILSPEGFDLGYLMSFTAKGLGFGSPEGDTSSGDSVPEPSGILFVIFGAAGIGNLARRRRAKASPKR